MDKSNSFETAMTAIERYLIWFRTRRERSTGISAFCSRYLGPRVRVPIRIRSIFVILLSFSLLERARAPAVSLKCNPSCRPSATGYAHRWHTWFLFLHDLHFYGFRSAPKFPLHSSFSALCISPWNGNTVSDTICIYLHIASQRMPQFMPDVQYAPAKTLL